MKQATAAKKSDITLNAIVDRVPRTDPNKERKERKLGGNYRVIQGTVLVPRPTEVFLNADGTEKPFEAKTEEAIPGDTIRLTDLDASRLLEKDIIEPLDAKPSRLGKVTVIPKIHKNYTGMSSTSPGPVPNIPSYVGA